MRNKEKLHQRYLRDPLPARLGGLSATLARISSTARQPGSNEAVLELLDEAKHLIEWTASETDPSTAAELVQMQRLIALWQKSWPTASQSIEQRILLSVQAKTWSDAALDASGLL